jgi:hypothetical protein
MANEFEKRMKTVYGGTGGRGAGLFSAPKPSGDEFDFITDIFTGASRIRESDIDRPELPPTMMQGGGVPAFNMSLSRGDIGKLQILEKMIGQSVPNEMDDYGNIHVTIDGPLAARMNIDAGTYFINKPGASAQDAADIITTGAIELFTVLGASKVLGFLGKGSSIARVGGAMIGAGGASITQDVLAGQMGSEEGIDYKTALIATLFGGAGEGVARISSTVLPFLSKFFKNKRFWSTPDGGSPRLTLEGANILERAGIPADRITPEFVDKFEKLATEAVNPVHAARVADAASLPGPKVPLSRGDVILDVIQQAEEDAMLQGQLGGKAKGIMTEFRDVQAERLTENVPAIQTKIGGPVVSRTEGMETLQSRLRKMQNDLQDEMSTAYTLAERMGDTSFDSTTITAFHDHARSVLMDSFDDIVEDSSSFISKRLKELDNMAFKAGDTTFTAPLKEIDVGRMYKWRKKLSGRARAEFGKPEGVALKKLVKEFDSFMEGAIDNKLFRGNVKGILQWRKAIRLRRELTKKFESDNIVAKLIEVLPGDGRFDLRFEPSEALNYLFGANSIGAKTGATNALRKIKELVGVESVEWLGLKEEGVMRLFKNALKEIGGKPVFSGAKFRTDLDNAMYRAPELMKELFSSSDLALLQQMKRVASMATERVEGALNPPHTAGRLVLLADRLLGTGKARQAITAAYQKFMNDLGEYSSRSGAIRATRLPVETTRRGIPIGLGAAAGGTIAQKRRRSPGLLGEEYKAWKVRGPQMMTR